MTTNIKVLHLYRTFFPDPPGGLQEAIKQIALSTSMSQCDNKVFCLSPNPEPKKLTIDGIKVYREKSFFAPSSCDIGFLGAVKKFVELRAWADIVQIHYPWPFADLLNVAPGNRKPTLMTYHSDIIGKKTLQWIYWPLMKKTFKDMEYIVTTSKRYGETSAILQQFADAKKLSHINYGLHEFSYEKIISEAKQINVHDRFGLDAGEYFLFLGVLRPYKGLDYLFDASDYCNFSIAVGGSGNLTAQYKKKALKYKNIKMLGQVSDAEKMALILNCKAMVLPSHLRSEAFGIVLIEASMCSKPMISCELGTGTSFANLDNVTGFVVRPGDPVELANAMKKIHDDPALAIDFGKNARHRFDKLFSANAIGNAYTALYLQMLNHNVA